MLQIKNVTLTYKKDMRELVSGLSFVLNTGDKAAIIGEEGNGKSTLLKWIYDQELVDGYIESSGELIRNNCILGYLTQELSPAEKKQSVYEYLSTEPEFWECSPGELAQLSAKLHIPVSFLYTEQIMDTLSGGEKVKIRMLRLLCRKPDVLLLDEPSNDLDIQTLQWLEQLILDWSGPVLFISHDETLLERTANRIIHLEQVKKRHMSRHTVANTDYRTYVEERAGGLKKQEQLARKERSDYKKQQEKLRRIEQTVEHQQNTISRQDPHGARLLKKKMHAVKAMERRFEKDHESMTEMPDVEEAILMKFKQMSPLPHGKTVLDLSLAKLCVGERVLVQDIHLRVVGSEKICLIGDNGVGKTTLLKQIAEQLSAREDIKAAYMPQNYDDLLLDSTLVEMTPAAFLTQTGTKDEITEIRTFLGSLKYTAEEMSHSVRELSGGQKAKLLLLKICMSGANVLILDEPTRNFSPLSNPVIRSMLKEYKGAIISASHDRKYIEEVCDRVYELRR